MKKILLGVLAAIVVIVGGAAGYLILLKKPAQRPAPDIHVQMTPERIARGDFIFHHVSMCAECHSETDQSLFGGPVKPGREGAGGECWTHKMHFPGTLCSKNLTSDKETGLGNWTDGEIIRAIREGVDKDGNALFNLMPYDLFASMSDEDVESVVAYLRTLKPIHNEIKPRQLDFPLSIIVKFMPHPLSGPVPQPNKQDPKAYGKYLTTIAGCHFCHTPVDSHMQSIAGKDFSGGHEFWNPAGGEVVSQNLTSDPSGITGQLTKEQFIARIKAFDNDAAHHVKVDPAHNTVMPWLYVSGMPAEDLGVIYDYIKSQKPIHHVVTTFPNNAVSSAEHS